MSILTGPEIRRLVEPCKVSELKVGDHIWHEDTRYKVLAIHGRGDHLDLCLESLDGRQGWSTFADDRLVTRCGLKGERIVIAPFDPQFVGPASYDLHLGDTLLTYGPREVVDCAGYKTLDHVIDPENPSPTVEHKLEPDGRWLLMPGKVYLGVTKQYTGTYGLRPMLYGRSSVGRMGLFIHVTAGVGDPFFEGHWTLELVATQAIRVRSGMKIGQIAYDDLIGEVMEYKGRYQKQPDVPIPSRFHLAEQPCGVGQDASHV